MKAIPLTLSTDDVKAIIEGRKTRHTVPAPVPNHDHFGTNIMDWGLSKHPYLWRNGDRQEWRYHVQSDVDSFHSYNLKSPFGFAGDSEWQTGMPPEDGMYWVDKLIDPILLTKDGGEVTVARFKRMGSILYVKEKHCIGRIAAGEKPDGRDEIYVSQCKGEYDIIPYEYCYSSHDIGHNDVSWRSPVTMPREASRIWLENVGQVCKRVQDITEEEAKAEGIEKFHHGYGGSPVGVWYRDYKYGQFNVKPKESFKTLWKQRHGPDSWNNNEWVFSCNWKVLSTTGKPSYL